MIAGGDISVFMEFVCSREDPLNMCGEQELPEPDDFPAMYPLCRGVGLEGVEFLLRYACTEACKLCDRTPTDIVFCSQDRGVPLNRASSIV